MIRLPDVASSAQPAPVFVDAFEEPGRLLYRFDAVIANQGGTLDLFGGGDGGVRQAVLARWEAAGGAQARRDTCRRRGA